ncbi:synaptotagmin-like protein 2 isoform X4 [Latimeria chalumnae]|uniref:synaptotagmin-like protein 2 isoform X4 n=1 Tax=Latimeria chalumnae TaxID=7897 RepID=UPI00313D3079
MEYFRLLHNDSQWCSEMKLEMDSFRNLDLSFLSSEEQAVIQQVLNRDADLKRQENGRIRLLKLSIFDPQKLKIMTGEWFDEMKARRYGECRSGIDILKSAFRSQTKSTVAPDQENALHSEEEQISVREEPQNLHSRSPFAQIKNTPSKRNLEATGAGLLPEPKTGVETILPVLSANQSKESLDSIGRDDHCFYPEGLTADIAQSTQSASNQDLAYSEDSAKTARGAVEEAFSSGVSLSNFEPNQSSFSSVGRNVLLGKEGSQALHVELMSEESKLQVAQEIQLPYEDSINMFPREVTASVLSNQIPFDAAGDEVVFTAFKNPMVHDEPEPGASEAESESFNKEIFQQNPWSAEVDCSKETLNWSDSLVYEHDSAFVAPASTEDDQSSANAPPLDVNASIIMSLDDFESSLTGSEIPIELSEEASSTSIKPAIDTCSPSYEAESAFMKSLTAVSSETEKWFSSSHSLDSSGDSVVNSEKPAKRNSRSYSPREAYLLDSTFSAKFSADAMEDLNVDPQDHSFEEKMLPEKKSTEYFSPNISSSELEMHTNVVLAPTEGAFVLPTTEQTPTQDATQHTSMSLSSDLPPVLPATDQSLLFTVDHAPVLLTTDQITDELDADTQDGMAPKPRQFSPDVDQYDFELSKPERQPQVVKDESAIYNLQASDERPDCPGNKLAVSTVESFDKDTVLGYLGETEVSDDILASARMGEYALKKHNVQDKASPESPDDKTSTDAVSAPLRSEEQSELPELHSETTSPARAPASSEAEIDFEDFTSESSYGSDNLAKARAQSSQLSSASELSGSVMSLYSDAGDFGNVSVQGAVEVALRYDEIRREFLIQVEQCQDLAVANVKKQRTDPYVKTYLYPDKSRPSKRKTSIKKNTVNPVFNEFLKYKITKIDLQTRTLNISVWHNDSLGRNVFLGETEIELRYWDWRNDQLSWYNLLPKTAAPEASTYRGQLNVAIKYIPAGSIDGSKPVTGELHIWLKEVKGLQALKPSGVDSFIKCCVLPDLSKKSRQKTRIVKKCLNPIYNHTMVYDGFRHEEIKEACVELTIWDHDTFTNQFLGGVRLSLGTGKSYGRNVDWMDSNEEEIGVWRSMLSRPNEWIDEVLPLRPTMAKRK